MTNRPVEPRNRDWSPARWVRIVLPAVVLIVWLAAAGVGGPTFGKLSSVSTNDQAAFLPASSESTEVIDWQQKFVDAKAIPAIVVLESATAIPRQNLGAYVQLGERFGAVEGVQAPEPPAATAVAGPIPSQDGMAVEFIVPITDQNDIGEVVADLRQVAETSSPPGTTAYVTGPAGLTADLVSAFGGIDGLLLLVAAGAVLLILFVVYRAAVLPFLVLFTSIFALSAAILVIYAFAGWGWIKLSGQSQGILSILVIGAATDYSFLLVARYREALQQVDSKWAAIGRAWRASLEPIVASGATVIVALLCLLFSDLNSNKSLGPIAAVGIVFALLSSLTLLPILLVLFNRVAFWPFEPQATTTRVDAAGGLGAASAAGRGNEGRGSGSGRARATALRSKTGGGSRGGSGDGSGAPGPTRTGAEDAVPDGLQGIHGLWRRVGTLVARQPRLVWVASLVLLLAGALGLFQLKANGVSQADLILTKSQAVAGEKVAAEHFPSGLGSPAVIIVDQDKAEATLAAVTATAGIDSATVYAGNVRPGTGAPPLVREGKMLINAVFAAEADSHAAEQVVRTLRTELPKIDPGVLVGGFTAIALDTNTTAQSDLRKIIPIVLVVILFILMLLLRSILAPVLLIGSVVVSYAAALGVSALMFNHVFRFPGADASVPLFGFVFLVALGVDYNIFLMTRVREESIHLGTRPGILRGLGMTGSVITSAGVVLAATFAALGVIPILFLAQIAFIVAFGVLLDTVIVRSLLVPALSYDIGRAIWWPSKLGRRDAGRPVRP